MLIHGQRETQRVINIIIAGNGLTLTQPAVPPQNLSLQTGIGKGGGCDKGWMVGDTEGWMSETRLKMKERLRNLWKTQVGSKEGAKEEHLEHRGGVRRQARGAANEIGGEDTGRRSWHAGWIDRWRAGRTAWWEVRPGHRAGVKYIAA